MDFIIFPFHKVSKGERVAIYGAGEIYQLFKQQIDATNYCDIAWLVDRSFESDKGSDTAYANVECYGPSIMDWSLPEKIIVASVKFRDEIVSRLRMEGVDEKKLITIEDKQTLRVQDRLTLQPDHKIWKNYYQHAEQGALPQYQRFIEPVLKRLKSDICFDSVLDFACGEGRIAELFKPQAKQLYLVDAGKDAIEHCKQRFINDKHVHIFCNNSGAIPLNDSSVSLIYSWDAMVHFSYKSLDFYLSEFNRIAMPGSYILMHHSNLANLAAQRQVFELWSLNPGGRSNVSKEDITFLASHYGLEVVEQNVFDWGVADMDCMTVLYKQK